MSEIIWQKSLRPESDSVVEDLTDETFELTIAKTKRILQESSKFPIPDPKAFRSMSRAAIFLSSLCMEIKPLIQSTLEKSPFAVGIYCAVENGPIDGPTTKKIISGPVADFTPLYKKLRNPKMYLKQLPNLAPAQLGISLGIQGVMNVYTHSRMGSLQALEQAEEDLWNDRVKLALVCSAHAFDDFVVIARTRKFDERILSEGAAALLLTKNTEKTLWNKKFRDDPHESFGISNQLVHLIQSKTGVSQ